MRCALVASCALMIGAGCQSARVAADNVAPAETWWRGNTHTHTLWSDGDDFPEAVADWYKRNGYHFLAITDHNTLASTERWFPVPASGRAREAYTKARERFGPSWVEERRSGDTLRVRLKRLSSALAADSLMRAMERGAFYASTGVTLSELRREAQRLMVAITGDPGVSYTTQFIGTRRGYDTVSVAVRDSAGVPVTRRYSRNVGAVLSEVRGTTASYTMRGDELYVRARIVSTKAKANPSYEGEVEMAWTQPVQP